jgi:hypothetical protein
VNVDIVEEKRHFFFFFFFVCAQELIFFIYINDRRDGPISTFAKELYNDPTFYALCSFYDALSGDGWFINTDWKSDTVSYCLWHGLACDGANNLVSITLIGNSLDGTIDLGILSNITTLQILTVSNNLIEGFFFFFFCFCNFLFRFIFDYI